MECVVLHELHRVPLLIVGVVRSLVVHFVTVAGPSSAATVCHRVFSRKEGRRDNGVHARHRSTDQHSCKPLM